MLDQKTEDRIKHDSIKFCEENGFLHQIGYVGGATGEVEHSSVLVEALEKIVSDANGALRDTDSIKAHQRILNRATEALNQYNNPK